MPPSTPTAEARQAPLVAHNLRRLMVKYGMTYEEVVEASGLDERTVRSIAHGRKRPHARTLYRLAEGFGVAADEFFVDSATIDSVGFDAATNHRVGEVIQSHPELFEGWTAGDYAELYSRFGKGGALTEAGTLAAAEHMNHKRQVVDRVRVILESADGALLADFVELLYQRIQVHK